MQGGSEQGRAGHAEQGGAARIWQFFLFLEFLSVDEVGCDWRGFPPPLVGRYPPPHLPPRAKTALLEQCACRISVPASRACVRVGRGGG